VELPGGVRVVRASELDLQHHDVVFFAVHARDLRAEVAAHAERIPGRAGVVLLCPPATQSPAGDAAERVRARAVVTLHVAGDESDPILGRDDPVVAAGSDAPFMAQIADVLRRAGLKVKRSGDVTEPTTNRARRKRAA
jgi:hypothetical protein